MTLLGLSSSQNGLCLGCHRPTKMTLLGLSSSLDKNSAWAVIVLDKNDSAWLSSSLDKNDSAWVVTKNDSALVAIVHGQKGLCLGCHRPWTKMTLLGLSSSLDKNDSAWVVIVPGQK